MQYCLLNPSTEATADEIARALGIPRPSLSRYAHRGGLRGVRDVRVRCRLFLAIGLLSASRLGTEHIASLVGLSSASQLRHSLQWHLGVKTSEIGKDQDLRSWCARLFKLAPA